MLKNKKFLALLGAILALASFAVWATNANIVWTPARFAPASVTPGQSINAAVSFTNRGLSNINGKELSLEVRGDAAGIVLVTAPSFPENIKKGESVSVNISIRAPSDQTVRVVAGSLVLLKMKSDGKTKEVFGDALPMEITLSPFFIPPAPDKALDESTIEGVDSDANGVPDRVDRFIAFAAPESEKKRAAMTLSAKAQQDFFIDYLEHFGEDPNDPVVVARVRGMADMRGKVHDCRRYIYGDYYPLQGAQEAMDKNHRNSREIEALYMDTPERLRAFQESERPLVATSYKSVEPEQYKQQCLDLGFDPDSLPN